MVLRSRSRGGCPRRFNSAEVKWNAHFKRCACLKKRTQALGSAQDKICHKAHFPESTVAVGQQGRLPLTQVGGVNPSTVSTQLFRCVAGDISGRRAGAASGRQGRTRSFPAGSVFMPMPSVRLSGLSGQGSWAARWRYFGPPRRGGYGPLAVTMLR